MPKQHAPDLTYLDMQRLQQLRAALPYEKYIKLYETFLAELGLIVQSLAALSGYPDQNLANALHQLKGCAANFGASAIWQYTEQFEQKATSQDWQKNAQNIQELIKLCAETDARLRMVLSQEKAGA